MSYGPLAFVLPDAVYRMGWVRLFGWGIAWKDHRKHPAVFSERMGKTKHLHVGPWCFTWLRRTA